MKMVLGLVLMMVSFQTLALDETLGLDKLPVETTIEFNVNDTEMIPNTGYAQVCGNLNSGDSQIWMNFDPSQKYRVFPAQTISARLVSKILFEDSGSTIEVCQPARGNECAFSTNAKISDIVFNIYLKFDSRTIADLRQLVESCGGIMTIPDPTPYP